MPTLNELAGLHDTAKTYKSECRGLFGGAWDIHLTELIRLKCIRIWASETHGSDAAYFMFGVVGRRNWFFPSVGLGMRALPVRSGK